MNDFNTWEELDISGFQTVKSELFTSTAQRSSATCSLCDNRISFGKVALQQLNNCEYVKLEVNPESKCLLVIPVNSSDSNCIRWVSNGKEPQLRNLQSKSFCDWLRRTWGFDQELDYRANGRLVTSKKKVMMVFDFSSAVSWKPKTGRSQ